MAIDFTKALGNKAASSKSSSTEERPKAKYWLNIGYNVEHGEGDDRTETFVSLPVGIPLDLQDKITVRSSNHEFASLQTARNELLEQLVEYAGGLEAGEERILTLSIQLRRIKEEPVPIKSADNVFSAKLNFG